MPNKRTTTAPRLAAELSTLDWEPPAQEVIDPRLAAAIIQCADDAIICLTIDGIVTLWNSAAERMFGYRRDEMIGQHVSKLSPPEYQSEQRETLEALRAGGVVGQIETIRMRADGTWIDVSLAAAIVRNDRGEVESISSILRDITERKRAEERLRQSEHELNLIINSVPAFISFIGINQRYQFANAKYCELFGLSVCMHVCVVVCVRVCVCDMCM